MSQFSKDRSYQANQSKRKEVMDRALDDFVRIFGTPPPKLKARSQQESTNDSFATTN